MFGNGQAEARSLDFTGVSGPVERLKDEILFFYINSCPEVFNAQNGILSMTLDFYEYLVLGLRILAGMARKRP